LDTLSPALAQGIFAHNTSYPVFIRFSNGMGRGFVPLSGAANQSDAIPDIRGMGIKLFNVSEAIITPGYSTQVFTLTTTNAGFLNTDNSATGFFGSVQSGKLSLAGWLATNPSLALLFAQQATSGIIGDLLSTNWYQQVPQLHGSTPAKYHIYPCATERQRSPSEPLADPGDALFDYLRTALQNDLATQSVCLRMAVQFYQNEASTPVNDSTVVWNTPFQDVAQIDIPHQTFGTTGQEAFCSWMSFNPAAAIAAHAPVGNAQAIRTKVYTAMATLRHQLSGESQGDAAYQDWVNYPNM